MPLTPAVGAPESKAPPESGTGRLKRVLYVLSLNPAGKFGSLEEQVLTLARTFRERGSLFLPVFLGQLDPVSTTEYTADGLSYEALDLRQFRFATLNRLVQLVRDNRIEVVHWNFYDPLANPYLWSLTIRAPRVEHYFTDHISRPAKSTARDNQGSLKGLVKRSLARRYRKVLCISDYVLGQVQSMHWSNAQRVHYFINTVRFRSDPAVRPEIRGALGVQDEIVALIVAYLIKDKGIDVALRALAELPTNVVLWIIGEGPELKNLQSLAQTHKLGTRVQFLGLRRHVEPFMQACDCLICPSIWAEGVGLVNLEAMACGLPVIASRIGGIPEYVQDGRTGLLFTPGDHRDLVDCFHRLLSSQPARQVMSQQARLVAVDCFSTQERLGDYLSLYEADVETA